VPYVIGISIRVAVTHSAQSPSAFPTAIRAYRRRCHSNSSIIVEPVAIVTEQYISDSLHRSLGILRYRFEFLSRREFGRASTITFLISPVVSFMRMRILFSSKCTLTRSDLRSLPYRGPAGIRCQRSSVRRLRQKGRETTGANFRLPSRPTALSTFRDDWRVTPAERLVVEFKLEGPKIKRVGR